MSLFRTHLHVHVTWLSKMAEHSETVVFKMARFLANVHIVVGFLMLGFGIADSYTSLSNVYSQFWTGWIFIASCFGLWVSQKYSQKQDRKSRLSARSLLISGRHARSLLLMWFVHGILYLLPAFCPYEKQSSLKVSK